MFLAELVKGARVIDGEVGQDDVALIPAGCRPGVDYSMVVSRADYEAILVRYRASEPACEAILMSLGKGKKVDDPVWDIMLQNEIVASQYSMLCSDFHAARLESTMDEVEHEMQDSVSTPVSLVKEEGDSSGVAGSIEQEESVSEPEDEGATIESKEEAVSGETTTDFFEGVATTAEAESIPDVPENEEFSSLDGEPPVPATFDLVAMARAAAGLETEAVSSADSVEVEEESVEEGHTETEPLEDTDIPPSMEDDDYFPKGIRPEEEDAKVNNTSPQETLDDEGHTMQTQATKILNELANVFMQFGPETVCRQALSCSFSEFRSSWGSIVPGIAELDSEHLIDTVKCHVYRIITDKRGDERYQAVNAILKAPMKILYEE